MRGSNAIDSLSQCPICCLQGGKILSFPFSRTSNSMCTPQHCKTQLPMSWHQKNWIYPFPSITMDFTTWYSLFYYCHYYSFVHFSESTTPTLLVLFKFSLSMFSCLIYTIHPAACRKIHDEIVNCKSRPGGTGLQSQLLRIKMSNPAWATEQNSKASTSELIKP